MKMFKYLVLLSVLLLCNITKAENISQSFSLESPLSGTIYGPFVLQDNFVAEINSRKYLINLTPNGFLQLKDIANNKVSEPYEFTKGRMIRLNKSLFTITDVKEIPYVKPLPAPKQKQEFKPAPKPMAKPIVATTAVAATAVVKPTKTEKPTTEYKQISAMWKTAPKQTPKPATTYVPKILSKPKAKPVVKPAADASAYFTSSRYKSKRKPTTTKSPYKSSSLTVPYKPKKSSTSKLRPYKSIAFSDRLGISVDISALEKVKYEYKISGVEGSSNMEISRNSVGVKLKVMPFTLKLGKVMRADWGGQTTPENLSFQNIDLGNGGGWWGDIKYAHQLLQKNGWIFAATSDGSYRRETYDLSYGAWQSSQVVVSPEGTNDVERIETVSKLAYTTQPAEFTEIMLEFGLALSYTDTDWGCWANADMIAYHDADIKSDISVEQGNYTIDVDRSKIFIATLGASIKRGGINWFTTVNLVGENAIRFGANYKF